MSSELYKEYQDIINYIFPDAVSAFANTRVLPSIAIGTAVYYIKNRVMTENALKTKHNVFNTTKGTKQRLISYNSIYDSIIEKYTEISEKVENGWIISYKEALGIIFKDKPNTMHDVMVIINDLGLKGYDKLYIDEYIKQYSKLNGKEIIEDIVNEEVPEVDEDNNEEEMNKNNIIEADNNINIDRIVYNVINDNTGEVEYTTFILEEAINKCNINSHVYDTDMNIIYPKDAKIDTIIVEEDNKNTDINYSNSIVSYSSIPDIITNDSINEEDIYPIYVKNINVYKNPHDTRPFRCITGNYYIQGEEVNKRTLLTKKPNDTSIKSIIGWVKSSKL